jgi:transcriptional regulator with XRE-family HTH domain
MEYNFYDIGDRLQKLRKQAGYSQEKLIEILGNMGIQVCRNTISKMENGTCKSDSFSLRLLAALAQIYDCEIGYLLCEYDCKTGRNTDIKAVTGLSDNALNLIKEMDIDSTLVLNSIIERGDIQLFVIAIQRYFEQTGKDVKIGGVAVDSEYKELLFNSMCSDFLKKIYNGWIYDKNIFNHFLKQEQTKSVSEFWDASIEIEKNINTNRDKKESEKFIAKMEKKKQERIHKISDTDFYDKWLNNK